MKKLVFVFAVFAFAMQSCKKDKVEERKTEISKTELNQAKSFTQIDPIPVHPQVTWSVLLRSDGSADIAPGMDTMEKSTYNIKGNSLTVKTNRGISYEFEILSATDIKLKDGNGVVLRWKKLN